jgi:hypothetical protein
MNVRVSGVMEFVLITSVIATTMLKVNLFLCLTKHREIKAYVIVDVYTRVLLTPATTALNPSHRESQESLCYALNRLVGPQSRSEQLGEGVQSTLVRINEELF